MILIMMHHIYQNAKGFGIFFPLPLAHFLQDIGYLATCVFFLLSGFGLYHSLAKNKVISIRYIISHIFKLLQPFIFIYVFDVLTNIVVHSFDFHLFAKNLFTLSLTNSGSLWFMKIIFLLYIIVFLIHSIFKDSLVRLIFLWISCCAYIVLAICFHFEVYWWNSILCFPIGYSFGYINIPNAYEQIKRSCPRIEHIVWGG